MEKNKFSKVVLAFGVGVGVALIVNFLLYYINNPFIEVQISSSLFEFKQEVGLKTLLSNQYEFLNEFAGVSLSLKGYLSLFVTFFLIPALSGFIFFRKWKK